MDFPVLLVPDVYKYAVCKSRLVFLVCLQSLLLFSNFILNTSNSSFDNITSNLLIMVLVDRNCSEP